MYISNNLTSLPVLSTTWKPEMQPVIWQNLPVKQHLGRRILDKKLPGHAILAKIWYVGECISLTIWHLCQFIAPYGNQKSRLLFDRTYHFNNTWEGEYLIKNYPAMRFSQNTCYVGGCTSLTIWWLCQFLAPPWNQKSRLLFDRTYHFNNTWEGEYSIKNYPAMRFWQKFDKSEGVHLWQSDDSASS